MSTIDSQSYNVHADSYPTMTNRMPCVSDERNEKPPNAKADVEAKSNFPVDDVSDVVLHNEREIATHVSVDDDSSLNPWIFHAFLLGLGPFGGSLGMIV